MHGHGIRNCMDKALELLKRKIENASDFYIYGAGIVSMGAKIAIKYLWKIDCKGTIVTRKNPGDSEAVKEIPDINLNSGLFILVATPEQYHKEITEILRKRDFENFLCLDAELEYLLMGEYLKQKENIHLIEDDIRELGSKDKVTGDIKDLDACIYMAISHGDHKLEREYTEQKWVKKIQVGAANTDKDIVACKDNTGDNISPENPIYGEMTASYWAWKNSSHDIEGLYHYRRVLDIDADALRLISEGKIDVILPLPFVCIPDTSAQYGRYLEKADIKVMRDIINEAHPELTDKVETILSGNYLYNYNILVARKEVLDAYCGWVFPMLKEIARQCEINNELHDKRKQRYIGRVGEVLTSLYFQINSDRIKVSHARKVWRV